MADLKQRLQSLAAEVNATMSTMAFLLGCSEGYLASWLEVAPAEDDCLTERVEYLLRANGVTRLLDARPGVIEQSAQAPTALLLRAATPQLQPQQLVELRATGRPLPSQLPSVLDGVQVHSGMESLSRYLRHCHRRAASSYATPRRHECIMLRYSMESLVPIRLTLLSKHGRFQEAFLWDAEQRELSPASFAAVLATEMQLDPDSEQAISRSITTQLLHQAPSLVPMDRSLEFLFPIAIDIEIGGLRFHDEFEWDIAADENDATTFASQTCKDMGLPAPFQGAIAHTIQEQVLFQRTLVFRGAMRDGGSWYSGLQPINVDTSIPQPLSPMHRPSPKHPPKVSGLDVYVHHHRRLHKRNRRRTTKQMHAAWRALSATERACFEALAARQMRDNRRSHKRQRRDERIERWEELEVWRKRLSLPVGRQLSPPEARALLLDDYIVARNRVDAALMAAAATMDVESRDTASS